jgi:hypothetical protein
MGYPVNSAKDDFAFSINGTKGFFTTNRNGSDDILAFDYAQSIVKIKGKLYLDAVFIFYINCIYPINYI